MIRWAGPDERHRTADRRENYAPNEATFLSFAQIASFDWALASDTLAPCLKISLTNSHTNGLILQPGFCD
jgi:hypothetical protein